MQASTTVMDRERGSRKEDGRRRGIWRRDAKCLPAAVLVLSGAQGQGQWSGQSLAGRRRWRGPAAAAVEGIFLFFFLRVKEDDIIASILQKNPGTTENYKEVLLLGPDGTDDKELSAAGRCHCSISSLGSESASTQRGSHQSPAPESLHLGTPTTPQSSSPSSSTSRSIA